MGATHDFGDSVDLFVQAHFRSLGYELGYPKRDNGTDFLISKDGGQYQRVQVKHLPPSGKRSLIPAQKRNGHPTKEACRAASLVKRPYDILVIACEERMWVIPEDATRGITCVTVKAQVGKRKGEWLMKCKWNQYLQERKTWAKHASADLR